MTSKNYADIIREYERLKRLNQQLLEACKEALSALENCYDPGNDNKHDPIMQSIGKAKNKARATIAKAETL